MLVFGVWIITGYAIVRYGLRVTEIIVIPFISAGAGIVVYLWLINVLLRTGMVELVVWAVPVLMLAGSGLLWRLNRSTVQPLQLTLSWRAAIAVLVALATLGAFLINVRAVTGGEDETGHSPFSAMTASIGFPGLTIPNYAGLPGLTIPSYADPRYCTFYHYGIDAIAGALFRQTNVRIADLYATLTYYNTLTVVGLVFVFLWLLMRRTSVTWPVIGSFIFSLAGPGRWLVLLNLIPGIKSWFDAPLFARIHVLSKAANLAALVPSADSYLVFRLPGDFNVSFSWYNLTPNPAAFCLVALLTLIGWIALKPERAWYWYAGLGILAATSALFQEVAMPLVAVPIGVDLLWRAWGSRTRPLPAVRQLLLFAVPALMVLILQGGVLTDSLFCKTHWKDIYSSKTAFTQGGNLTDFRVSDRIGFYQSTWSPNLKGDLTHPSDWPTVLVDWGFGFALCPFMLAYAIAARHRKLILILATSCLMIALPFVLTNQGATNEEKRFAIFGLWFVALVVVQFLKWLWKTGKDVAQKVARALVVFLIVALTLTDLLNGIATVGKRALPASVLLTSLDYQVQDEWFHKLDPRLDAVYDPGRRFGGYSEGVARTITLFGTYGRLNASASPGAIIAGFTPGVIQWWDTGSPAALLGDGYTYFYIDDVTLALLPEIPRKHIENVDEYHLVEEWRDSHGHFRRLYSLPYQEVSYRVGDSLEVIGISLPQQMASPEQIVVGVRLVATNPMPDNYGIFIHIMDSAGNLVAQSDSPILGANFTTSTILPGYSSGVSRVLEVPAGLPPGEYVVTFGAYRYPSIERLAAFDADSQPLLDNVIELGRIKIR